MPPSSISWSGDPNPATDDNARASSSAPRTSKPTPARPTALLTKSWTSASVSPSTTSTRITVGANTSTAADASSFRSLPVSNTSSTSTRASTPIPELSLSLSTPQAPPAPPVDTFSATTHSDRAQLETLSSSDDAKVRVPSRQNSDRSGSHDGEHSSQGAFNDASEDEPEAVGITASSSIHALDLLHRVNDKAAADRASQSQTLRSRLSQLSVSRASSKYRSRSNSRDASAANRALPSQFLEPVNHPHPPSTETVEEQKPSISHVDAERLDDDTSGGLSTPLETGQQQQFADRKYYILSSAGKPIYISHASLARRKRRRAQKRRNSASKQEDGLAETNANESDEEDESSTTQVGVMQALISIFADEDSDKLRFIRQGDLLITFLLRAPLYLVCVSNWNEESSTLRQHLEYLYLQVISLVSASQLSRLFGRMPNFDLRRLLEGTEEIFDYMVDQLNANETEEEDGQGQSQSQWRRAVPVLGVGPKVADWASCHQWWLQALQPIRITLPQLRDQLTAALQPPAAESSVSATQPQRPKDLLYVLLIANGRIVTLLRPRKHSVHPIDLLLLTNTVMGSRSIKRSGGSEEAEIWLPFSMPKFAPQGFVHAYVKFLDPESWVAVPSPAPSSSPSGSVEQSRGDAKMTSSELAVIVVTADKDAFPTVSNWISSLVAKPPAAPAAPIPSSSSSAAGGDSDTASIRSIHLMPSKKKSTSTSKSRSASKTIGSEAEWMTTFQRHIVTLSRHLTDPINNVEEGAPRVSAYTCAELGLAGLRHFVYRSNSTIQLTSPTLPEPYSVNAADRKRLFTLYSLVHHNIHHPVPPSPLNTDSAAMLNMDRLTHSNPTTPSETSASTVMEERGLASTAFNLLSPQTAFSSTSSTSAGGGARPLLNADRRLKMQLVKTQHEQVLGWITSPFELYLCVNPQVSKSAIVAIANGLTKWIKQNEKDLFLVNAGSF